MPQGEERKRRLSSFKSPFICLLIYLLGQTLHQGFAAPGRWIHHDPSKKRIIDNLQESLFPRETADKVEHGGSVFARQAI